MTGTTGYSPLFDPDAPQPASFDAGRVIHRADEAPAGGYVYDPEGRIALAVNVALATGRPLLVEGQPGSGKSSLAADVARAPQLALLRNHYHVQDARPGSSVAVRRDSPT